MNSIRCRQCEHYIEANAGEGKIYGCDRSRCVFEPTTKNNLEIVIDAMEYRTNALIESIKSEILHFANAHCSGDDINIYDVFKVIDDCCEGENSTTKNDCEHCSKTYGTLGCCDFVSNEPVYSCKEGHEEYARGIRKLGATTKNDLPHCQHTDKEIAKSFIEDVEAVKDQLPCSEQMDFPNTFDEFAKDYGFRDKKEIYTNGSELIPVFRVKQWLEHISITKNDLGVDCIKKSDAINIIQDMHGLASADVISDAVNRIIAMPSVTSQDPILGKIRAEIEEQMKMKCFDTDDEMFAYRTGLENVIDIIDRYKAESEST